MKKNREELGRIHRETCRELKQIRAKMAEELGIELAQGECTYDGYCSGSCPKCRSEEMRLNAAIAKRQLMEANFKAKAVSTGIAAMAALCLSGCTAVMPGEALEGATTLQEEVLEGDVSYEEIIEGEPMLEPEDLDNFEEPLDFSRLPKVKQEWVHGKI